MSFFSCFKPSKSKKAKAPSAQTDAANAGGSLPALGAAHSPGQFSMTQATQPAPAPASIGACTPAAGPTSTVISPAPAASANPAGVAPAAPAATPTAADERRTKIMDLEATYGLRLDNQAGLQVMTKLFQGQQTPEEVNKVAQMKEWTDNEIDYLKRALARYAPLLGARRPQELGAQPLTSLSRARMRVDNAGDNRIEEKPDHVAFSSYDDQNVTVFDQALELREFPIEKLQFTGAVEHELSHALLERLPAQYEGKDVTLLAKFQESMPFWKGKNRSEFWRPKGNEALKEDGSNVDGAASRARAKDSNVEPPVTNYGVTSPKEDLAETMMLFFEHPRELWRRSQTRFKFVLENLRGKLEEGHMAKMEQLARENPP